MAYNLRVGYFFFQVNRIILRNFLIIVELFQVLRRYLMRLFWTSRQKNQMPIKCMWITRIGSGGGHTNGKGCILCKGQLPHSSDCRNAVLV